MTQDNIVSQVWKVNCPGCKDEGRAKTEYTFTSWSQAYFCVEYHVEELSHTGVTLTEQHKE